jgi:hypothetical protein
MLIFQPLSSAFLRPARGYRLEVTVVSVPHGSQWTLTLSDVPNPRAPIPVGSVGVPHGGFAA